MFSRYQERVIKLRIDVLNSFFQPEVTYECFKLLDIRDEEVNCYIKTTKMIVRFLQYFNGKVDNYSALIETFQNDDQILTLNHSSLCHPRSSENQQIHLKIDQFEARDMQPIKQFIKYQDSAVFRNIIDGKVDVFKSRKQSDQQDELDFEDSDTDTDSDYSNVIAILVYQIVSPAIEEFEEIGKHCQIPESH